MREISDVLPLAQLMLTSCNIAVLGFGFFKFMRSPHDNLEKRVTALEVKSEEHDKALKQGNDRFRHSKSTTEILMICMLALIDFELTFCAQTHYENTEDLLKAKNLLREHLAKKED